MLTTRVPLQSCPVCRHMLDAATSVSGTHTHMPKPGDATVCLHCATALRFNGELQVRVLTDEDLEEADGGTLEELARVKLAAVQRIINDANDR